METLSFIPLFIPLFIPPLMAIILSPLIPGVINRTKALFAGRKGQPIFQVYYDLWKLAGKGAVYSRTTSWIFRAGPITGLSSVLIALTLIPFGGVRALIAFNGDIILFAYILGLGRVFTILAALDTGSSFEGMGASREAQFSTLAEVTLFLGLSAVVIKTGTFSISGISRALSLDTWTGSLAVLVLAGISILAVFLAENCRIPVDDPNTHLELTMIHEVMVLDHGGPDLALILYAGTLKLWVLGALMAGIILPVLSSNYWTNILMTSAFLFILSISVGIIESTMARLRLRRIPQLLIGASATAVIALALALR